MPHLEFTVVKSCRVACHFCPQKTLAENYKSKERALSLDNFKLILSKVPKSVVIHFSGFSEPFLNPETPEMIRHANKKGFKVNIYSTLVGLTETGAEILRDNHPEFFRVHVSDGKAMKIADDEWIKQHEIFLKTGIKGSYMAMGKVAPKVESHLREKGIKYEVPEMLSRGGNLDIPTPYLEGKIYCVADRWHQNVVLPDGNVYVCCMDYGLTMPLGNLLSQGYDEIHKKAEEYRKNDAPADSICRKCEWAAKL